MWDNKYISTIIQKKKKNILEFSNPYIKKKKINNASDSTFWSHFF